MPVTYRERVAPPLAWWIIGLGITATLCVAVIAYVELPVALTFTCFAFAAVIAGLLAYAARIEVRDGELRVGRYRLEREYIGEVRALDARQTDEAFGPHADRDALFVSRPYVRTSVRVGIDDAADPHPAWLVASRRPEELAEAIRRCKEQ